MNWAELNFITTKELCAMLQSFILKVTYAFINLSSLKKECLFERVRKIREKYAVGQREPSFD